MTTPFAALIPDGSLVVSCQAQQGSVLRSSELMATMARAAVVGGAVAIRANGPEDIRAIVAAVDVPVIGIHKLGDPDSVFITPTPEAALDVVAAGAAIIALDGTVRMRSDGGSVKTQISVIRRGTAAPIMADVDTVEAGVRARDAGADAVATTLSGYTGRGAPHGVDLDLIAALAAELDCPIVAEGRIRTDAEVVAAREAGAHALVIGTAITNPTAITRSFVAALNGADRTVLHD